MIRVGSVNAGNIIRKALNIDFRLTSSSEVLAWVDRSLEMLEEIIHRAGKAGCDVVVLPEDTLGLSTWKAANEKALGDVLPEAVARMLDRFGQTAASYNMYMVCCNDTFGTEGAIRNTAFFLDRDGREIGRYHKVSLPVQEHLKEHGNQFPVFETPDMGGVGMLICYDMVFPESARCLVLGGADIIFNPTGGGAAFGGEEISRAAFRTRAVENFVYLVVSWGGWGNDLGSMIVSPRGEILVEEKSGGEVAIVDIDPFGDRQAADWSNWQEDMRTRLFRERRPGAYGMLTEPNPPVMNKLADLKPGPPEEIARMVQGAMTVGHGRFEEAEKFLRGGKIAEAIEAFESLRSDYPRTWFDRMSCERLAELRKRKSA